MALSVPKDLILHSVMYFYLCIAVLFVADTSGSSTLKDDDSMLQRDSFANRSFGLCSPDKAALAEQMHPSYNPRLFVDGGLYLDPDIIGTCYGGRTLDLCFNVFIQDSLGSCGSSTDHSVQFDTL